MAINARYDWRRMLDALRIPWRDRGANTRRGNVNIRCPWCRDDPSMHLAIAEDKSAYYCFRNSEHSGKNVASILIALGYNKVEATQLLNRFVVGGEFEAPETGITRDAAELKWQKFLPATDFIPVLDYLYSRGFTDPIGVAERYDIRYAKYGEWSARALIPLTSNGAVVSWTGRTLHSHIKPKYMMQDVADEKGLIYAPRGPRRIAVIAEGPLDALKINVACEDLPITAIALTGLAINDARIYRIRQFSANCEKRCLALDSSVSNIQRNKIIAQLAPFGHIRYITPLPILPPFDDPGEMPLSEIGNWVLNHIRSGEVASDTKAVTTSSQIDTSIDTAPRNYEAAGASGRIRPAMGKRPL